MTNPIKQMIAAQYGANDGKSAGRTTDELASCGEVKK